MGYENRYFIVRYLAMPVMAAIVLTNMKIWPAANFAMGYRLISWNETCFKRHLIIFDYKFWYFYKMIVRNFGNSGRYWTF